MPCAEFMATLCGLNTHAVKKVIVENISSETDIFPTSGFTIKKYFFIFFKSLFQIKINKS